VIFLDHLAEAQHRSIFDGLGAVWLVPPTGIDPVQSQL
jgi:hypothetical protein